MKKSVLIFLAFFCVATLSAQNTHRNVTRVINSPVLKSAQTTDVETQKKFTVSAPTIYTSESEFLNAVGSVRCLEEFNDPIFMPFSFVKPDTTIDSAPFNYTIETVLPGETLFSGFNCMSYELLEDTLLITNNKRHINFFGGYFFATDFQDGEFIVSPVSIIVGNYTYNFTAADSVIFLGFVFQDTIPYIEFKGTIADYTYATIDHFYVGDNLNFKPEIKSVAPLTANENTQYTYSIKAKDVDNNTLVYSLSGQPAGMEITDNVITWTPSTGVTTSGEITLTVSDGNLADNQKFTITVSPLTDIETNPEVTMSLRPNPATSYVTVVSPSKIISVQIIDVTGKAILTKKADASSLEVNEIASFPKGIYFVRVKTIKETKVLKLIKQ